MPCQRGLPRHPLIDQASKVPLPGDAPAPLPEDRRASQSDAASRPETAGSNGQEPEAHFSSSVGTQQHSTVDCTDLGSGSNAGPLASATQALSDLHLRGQPNDSGQSLDSAPHSSDGSLRSDALPQPSLPDNPPDAAGFNLVSPSAWQPPPLPGAAAAMMAQLRASQRFRTIVVDIETTGKHGRPGDASKLI